METAVPAARPFPRNPYADPTKHFVAELRALRLQPPYLPQLVQSAILVVLTALFALLYCTVGIIAQLYEALLSLMQSAQSNMKEDAAIENSAYAVSIGIYFLLAVPLFLVQLPFWIVGSTWKRSTFWGVTVAVLLLAFFILIVAFRSVISGQLK